MFVSVLLLGKPYFARGIGNEAQTPTVAKVQARRNAALECGESLAMQCVRVYNVACRFQVFAFSHSRLILVLAFLHQVLYLELQSTLEGVSKGLGLHRERVNGAPHGCLIHATSNVGCAVESGAGHGVEYQLFAPLWSVVQSVTVCIRGTVLHIKSIVEHYSDHG